jgi:thioredoxin 1
MTKEVTDVNFESEVVKSDLPVLVDFWAPWCGPCRQLSPVIDEIGREGEGKFKVVKCNIDENPESPSKYGVRSIPTLMIFKGGNLVDTKIGALPRSALNEWINNNI